MNKPIAVIINDVHYNLNTLEIADKAMRQAITKANSLNIPLIVAGDLHDTKANLRAECVNTMLETFSHSEDCYIMIGNHDLTNEKAETHSLNFLDIKPVDVVSTSGFISDNLWLIPYHSNPNELRNYLKTIPKGSTLVMHQGIQGSNSGEYIQDKSAINIEDVAGMRVISGHYHTRQNIELPEGGLWSYTGNPYTLNFAEANDPEKGFHVLYEDGSLEFIPTNLRKHIIIDISISSAGIGSFTLPNINPQDLLWVKVSGSKEHLGKVTKESVKLLLDVEQGFKLDLIPLAGIAVQEVSTKLSQIEQLDYLIEQSNSSPEGKTRLKETWRGLCE